MASPQIPPRPARSQASQATTSTAQAPTIPPRPANRRTDRSESPRSNFTRSPLNETPFFSGSEPVSELHRVASLNASKSSLDLPARPPSVSLPSIGQEGLEYDASTPLAEEEVVIEAIDSPAGSPTHTRKVSHDLPLHAPRPSITSAEAKQRVAAVVRADSGPAAVNQQAKPHTVSGDRSQKASSSFRPPSAGSHDRPGTASSAREDEHGIPIIGQQVPLAHQYGDVQAPSPSPFGAHAQMPTSPGFERPSTGKQSLRRHPSRTSFHAPPGSYGLHGHGMHENVDQFEKDWLAKHPDAHRDEIAAHSPAILDRHDYNLSAAQLNKLVRGSREAGFGTSGRSGMPDEQIGYLVSEQYASRNTSPKLPPEDVTKHLPSHAVHVDSPLHQASFTAGDVDKEGAPGATAKSATEASSVHVDAPLHKENKHIGRGQASEDEHVDLGPRGGNTDAEGGWINESGYGVPILASDEIDPKGEHLQPAVPPMSESRRGSQVAFDEHAHSRPNSRPSSRPGSIVGVPALGRSVSRNEYTPLEDVREYEPLFPDEEEKLAKKPISPADRFKQRPELRQRFPSQDIWEDAPASVMMSAEVETPEPEESAQRNSMFERPEQEDARKGEPTEAQKAQLLSREAQLAKSHFKPHVKQETRPVLAQHRFPSKDVWEDSPDSVYMTTTVGEEEEAEAEDLGEKAGAVVQTSATLPREGATAGAPSVVPTAAAEPPMIPVRPTRTKSPEKEDRAAPQIPARPVRRPSPNIEKPVVPPRPAKPLSQKSAEKVPTSASTSAAPATADKAISPEASSAAAKPKPPVPARPIGSKIAAMQAGFMSDLNKKLGLGPHVPKKDEPAPEEKQEEEKKPLEDARKGRARGPARRKPAASPSAPVATAEPVASASASRKLVPTAVFSLFDIAPSGTLTSTHADNWAEKLAYKEAAAEAVRDATTPATSQDVPQAVGFNAQGEGVHAPGVTPEAVKATAQVESAPALEAEAETSGEASDLGHASGATASSIAIGSSPVRDAIAAVTTGRLAGAGGQDDGDAQHDVVSRQEVKVGLEEGNEGPHELKKQRTTSSSAGTQTGEMRIVLDKDGANPKTLTAYKNGSAHEEGYAFVKDDKADEAVAADEVAREA